MTNPLYAERANLAELVQYQPGSIVSRTLIGKPSGTITLFAFAGGEELSEHTTPYDALLVILDGRARITIGDKTLDLLVGEATILPANVPHAVTAVADFKMMLTMIRS
jgi:quercetin dioxygenase-like cupin family protein